MYHCDLCDIPLKDEEVILLNTVRNMDTKKIKTNEDLNIYLDKISKEQKSICPTCKELYDQIFRYRREQLYLIKEELFGIWKLTTKDKNEKQDSK